MAGALGALRRVDGPLAKEQAARVAGVIFIVSGLTLAWLASPLVVGSFHTLVRAAAWIEVAAGVLWLLTSGLQIRRIRAQRNPAAQRP
jgi:hypothetical protein